MFVCWYGGFQPAFALKTIPNTDKIEKTEDCDCQGFNKKRKQIKIIS